ncbi:DUF2986 domain-containing protein [Psychrosphaera ytuae]
MIYTLHPPLLTPHVAMNRRKKINETLKKKAKKMNAKRNPKKKEKYISKAEREKLAQLDSQQHNEED